MNVGRVQIVSHSGKPDAVERERVLADWLSERNVGLSDVDPDLVISVGGDGTMLRAAQHAHSSNVPLLGVNQGTLGYLTEVDAGEETKALDAIFNGDYRIEERMMLHCSVESVGDGDSFVGLNEVLVERDSRHRLVRLLVSVGGERLGEFNADGVIVATPTGSTAYALSAGGPIVSPQASCLVVVPVSAHMIFSRPVVVAPDETVEITEIRGPAALSLDGALGCELQEGSKVVVRRHERPLQLVRLWGPNFVERLRTKLGLPG
jgi:NAD+ kinase